MNETQRTLLRDLDEQLVALGRSVASIRATIAPAVVPGDGAPLFAVRELCSLEELERRYTTFVLSYLAGNKTRAAEVLGVDASTLHRKLTRWADRDASRAAV